MADTKVLQESVNTLLPLAAAIIQLSTQMDILTNIDSKIYSAKEQLAKLQKECVTIEAKTKGLVDTANAAKVEAIEARSKADSLLAAANADVLILSKKAKAEANAQIDEVKKTREKELANIEQNILEANIRLKRIGEIITTDQSRHNAILDSMNALKVRLAG